MNSLHERVADVQVTTARTASMVDRLGQDLADTTRRTTAMEAEMERMKSGWKERADIARGMADVRRRDRARLTALGGGIAFMAAFARDLIGLLKVQL